MAYWWVCQGHNYKDVIDDGNLWGGLTIDGKEMPDKKLLQDILPGDFVFHYAKGFLRAISMATTSWRDAPRPAHYPTKHDSLNMGWLVTVEPIMKGLEITEKQVAGLLHHGTPGPIDADGGVGNRYISPLDPDEGVLLLKEACLSVGPGVWVAGEPDSGTRDPAATDAQVSTMRRVEQSALRKYHFNGKSELRCALCGELLPVNLLVAAHIKRRAECDERERLSFSSNSMPLCVLGCDALFEHGYLCVDRTGKIVSFARPSHRALSEAIDALVGRTCPAYDNDRAEAFSSHRDRSLAAHRC